MTPPTKMMRLLKLLKTGSIGLGGGAAVLGASFLVPWLLEKMLGGEDASTLQSREQSLTKEKIAAESKIASTQRAAETQLRKKEATQAMLQELGGIQQQDVAQRGALADRHISNPNAQRFGTVTLDEIFPLLY